MKGIGLVIAPVAVGAMCSLSAGQHGSQSPEYLLDAVMLKFKTTEALVADTLRLESVLTREPSVHRDSDKTEIASNSIGVIDVGDSDLAKVTLEDYEAMRSNVTQALSAAERERFKEDRMVWLPQGLAIVHGTTQPSITFVTAGQLTNAGFDRWEGSSQHDTPFTLVDFDDMELLFAGWNDGYPELVMVLDEAGSSFVQVQQASSVSVTGAIRLTSNEFTSLPLEGGPDPDPKQDRCAAVRIVTDTGVGVHCMTVGDPCGDEVKCKWVEFPTDPTMSECKCP